MIEKNLGAVTAYGHAIEGGYTGTEDEWYSMFFGDYRYNAFTDKPTINGITVTGEKTLYDYDIYERFGGSYFRITGNAGDDIEINGVYRGSIDDTGNALIGGIMEVGTTTVKIGSTTVEVDTPYFGLYKVSA